MNLNDTKKKKLKKILWILLGVFCILAILPTISVGWVSNKSVTGHIIKIENSDGKSNVYFEDGTVIKASNGYDNEIINIIPDREYFLTYKEFSGGLILKHRIYLDRLYLLKDESEVK